MPRLISCMKSFAKLVALKMSSNSLLPSLQKVEVLARNIDCCKYSRPKFVFCDHIFHSVLRLYLNSNNAANLVDVNVLEAENF